MKKGVWMLLLLITSAVFAQDYSKKEAKELEYAEIDYEIGDYLRALEVYQKFLEKEPDNGNFNLRAGICNYKIRRHRDAIPYLEKARELEEIEAYYYLGLCYHLEGRLEEEISLYQKYKHREDEIEQPIEHINVLIDQARYAQEMIDNPINVDVVNMGSPINTEYHEYVPLIYGEEDEIYFTSRRPGSTGGELDYQGNYFEDIYFSSKKYGFWQQPEQLKNGINTATHDACVGLSPDGYTMYMFRTSEDLVTGDLYSSERGEDGWESPELLAGEINSDAIETSASVTSDDRTIYFSSNREGGFGGMDIWRVTKLPTGEWSKAQNLGPSINTEKDEDSPFIHADNKTLYFISTGHKTMGGYDIFKSELKADGLWSEPENMGYPLNSLANDMNFVMSSDKMTGYFSSSTAGGYGGQDIYKINFKLEAKILSVVKGGVASDDTAHVPILANITVIDKRTKEVQGIYKSNPATGRFIMVVTPESSYQVIVEAEGYHTFSGELFFDAVVGFGSTIPEFKLVPIQVVSSE